MLHRLIIAQNRGGSMARTFQFFKPETLHFVSVQISNLYTQETWWYNQYHDEVEEGEYVLKYYDESGRYIGSHKLNVFPKTPQTLFLVVSHSEFVGVCSTKSVTAFEFEQMLKEKRLLSMDGYDG